MPYAPKMKATGNNNNKNNNNNNNNVSHVHIVGMVRWKFCLLPSETGEDNCESEIRYG
jgi:hypothetical protein